MECCLSRWIDHLGVDLQSIGVEGHFSGWSEAFRDGVEVFELQCSCWRLVGFWRGVMGSGRFGRTFRG